MMIFGLKQGRYRLWLRVLEEEGKQLTLMGKIRVAKEILAALIQYRPSGLKRRWRSRMRRCGRCPLYDAALKRCGPADFPGLGCRCFMPLAAMCKRHGYLTETGQDVHGFCW